MGELAARWTRLQARLAPRLAPLAARRATWLPLLAAALVLGVVGAALLLTAPGQVARSQEIDIEEAQPDAVLASLDGDRDRLSDLEELVAGTNPARADTDDDGLLDVEEVRAARFDARSNTFCPDPLIADADRDCDGDGLGNLDEVRAGTSPTDPDVDGDGLPDGLEVRGGSDPFTPDADRDADNDTLTTLQEFQNGTRADRADTDLDGLGDLEELGTTRTNPARLSSGGSGIADGWLQAFTLPSDEAAVGFQDPDGDALTNLEEYLYTAKLAQDEGERSNVTLQGKALMLLFARGLDPRNNDTDGDGMRDGYEVRFGLDPLDDGRADPRLGPKGDPDGDGLLNSFEAQAGSNPFLTDSDGDGLSDFEEVTTGWTVRVEDEVRTVTSDPSRADSDGDGLTDLEEKQGKAVRQGGEANFPPLDPRSPDTDLDGLGDLDEVTLPVVSNSEPRRLDPTDPDTDGDALLDGDEFRYWTERRDGSGSEFEEMLERLAKQVGEATATSATRDAALNGLAPSGDLDGDGKPNLLDPDSDGDGLDDGKEVEPDEKAISEGSRVRRVLPATDPALVDSDGEGLPDPWEHQYAQYDFALGDWNLNASRRDSLRRDDGKTDADRDLDADGVLHNGTAYARRVSYQHTNLFEFLSGTHPNLVDSDGDTLADGWETYFSCTTTRVPRRGCGPLQALPGGQIEVVVDLDPSLPDTDRDGVADANESGEATPYTRFVRAPPGPFPSLLLDPAGNETVQACRNDPATPTCDEFGAPDAERIVRLHGLRTITYGVESRKNLDPSLRDTDGDGIADAVELAAGLNPLDASDAAGDLDGDGLVNRAEAVKGTDLITADTDLGGLEDGKDPDPLYPPDDAPTGDTDCDGVLNKDEGPRGTSLADPDSDRDGLLDGPGIIFGGSNQTSVATIGAILANSGCASTKEELRQRFVARGIAQVRVSGEALFLGEDMYFASGSFPQAPKTFDTDLDGLPDGWEAYWIEAHGLRTARDPFDPGFVNDGDGLNNSAEYRSGMPPGWEGSGCGVWWLGTDPRSSDSDGDGLRDGTFLGGQLLGGADADFDLDNDGLSDFTGEDPFPLYDQANAGATPLAPCDAYASFVESWIFLGGRTQSATKESQPGVKVNQDYAKVRFKALSVDLDPADQLPPDEAARTIIKGARFLVRGKVVVAETGADLDKPVSGALVLVNLGPRSGATDDVLGVAMTATDGTFEVEGAVNKSRAATLAQGAVLFGSTRAAGSNVTWAPATSKLPPEAGYKLTVWTTNRQQSPTGPYGFAATKPGGGTYAAKGILGTSATSPSPDLDLPLLTLSSASRIELPKGLNVTAGGTFTASGKALDGLGDPLPKGFLGNGLLRVRWLGVEHKDPPVLVLKDGGFDLALPVDAATTLGPKTLEAVYEGSLPLVSGDRENTTVDVRYATNLTATVLNEGLRVVAGEPVVVEGQVRDARGDPVPAGLPIRITVASGGGDGNTTAAGRFRVEALVPAAATVGTQAVEVAFLGSSRYADSRFDAGFITLVQKTEVSIRASRSALGKDLVITGRLVDLGGAPVDDPTEESNTTVRVVTPAAQGEARVDGTEWRFTVPKEQLPGAGGFAVRVEFAGTKLYLPSRDAREVQLGSRTNLVLHPGDLARGLDAAVRGSLADEKGRGLAGERILVSLGNDTAVALTDTEGNWTRPVRLSPEHALGGLVARARYEGGRDGLLEPSDAGPLILQVVAATTLEVAPRTLALGPLPVNGTLRDDRGQAVPGAKLEVRLGDAVLGFAVTDLQGRFEVELPLPEGTPPGTHVLRVRFSGSGTLAPVEAAVAYRLLAPSRIGIESVGVLTRGQDGFVVANLTDFATGAPLASRPLELRIGDTPVGVAVTDARGVARIQGKPPGFLPPGNATVEVRFAGDDGHISSRASQERPIVVRTQLDVDLPPQVERGQLFRGGIVVRDDAGRPVAGQVVVVNFSSFAYPITLTTDASGRANFTGRMEAAGTGTLAVRFPGATGLAPSEQSFTIQSRAALLEGAGLLGLAVLVLALLVVAAALLARRLRAVQVTEVQRFLAEAEQRLIASTEYQASILWAYRRVVDMMRAQGFLVKESFTPRELLEAMAAAMPVERTHLERLVAVFEEARYSPHPIGPAQRDEALAALRGIEGNLRQAAREGQRPPPEVARG